MNFQTSASKKKTNTRLSFTRKVNYLFFLGKIWKISHHNQMELNIVVFGGYLYDVILLIENVNFSCMEFWLFCVIFDLIKYGKFLALTF